LKPFSGVLNLLLDRDVDYTIILRDGAAQGAAIIATCSKAKNVLKCFAVREEYRGEGITAILISR
jgi:[citrate (pro-3S)-lyase] ligase